MNKLAEKLKILLLLVVLGTVSSFSLELVSNFTKPIIEANKVRELKIAILKVLDIKHTEENIDKKFKQEVEEKKFNGQKIYYSKKEGLPVFLLKGSGFWEEIVLVVGLEEDLKSIKGLYVLEQQETPGLGGRISEEEFQSQFTGVRLEPEVLIVPAGTRKEDEKNKVDAITGATMTSKAVEKIINEKIKEKLLVLED